jgi:hypothetical protein
MNETLLLRFLERVHGHIGWLAVIALLHPAILLRNPKRRARLAVLLTTASVTLAGALGVWVYPAYRRLVKPLIFRDFEALGWWFERKEHLAVGALAFAWIGCILHLSISRVPKERQEAMAKLAHRSYVVATVLTFIVACIGVAVATYKSF